MTAWLKLLPRILAGLRAWRKWTSSWGSSTRVSRAVLIAWENRWVSQFACRILARWGMPAILRVAMARLTTGSLALMYFLRWCAFISHPGVGFPVPCCWPCRGHGWRGGSGVLNLGWPRRTVTERLHVAGLRSMAPTPQTSCMTHRPYFTPTEQSPVPPSHGP